MPTDAERWRFLADNNLALGRGRDGCHISHFEESDAPGSSTNFRPVASGKTADEAIDNAIARWERKHKRRFVPGEVSDETQMRGTAPGSAKTAEPVRGTARRSTRRP